MSEIVPKHKRIPRGKGYDKRSIKKHLDALDSYKGSLPKYCRANKLDVQFFAQAVQRSFPSWWEEFISSNPDLDQRACEYCKEQFFPNSARQVFCSRKCSQDKRRDDAYFGGKRREGIGVLERVCQICSKDIKGKLHVHHVYGKGEDPENEFMVALCSRCHMALEQLCINAEFADSRASWMRMIDFVWRKRHGLKDGNEGKHLRVFLVWEVKMPITDAKQ